MKRTLRRVRPNQSPPKVLVISELSHCAGSEVDAFCDQLVHSLLDAGAQAEAMRLPSSPDGNGLVRDMLARRSLDVWNVDRLISLRFPAHLVRHQNKALWAFDNVYPTHQAAAWLATTEAARVFCPTRHSAQALFDATGCRGSILPPPVVHPELFCGGESLGYLFAQGSITSRGPLVRLISAAPFAPNIRLILAGIAESAQDAAEARRTIDALGIADRVQVILRKLSVEERARFVNQSFAVAYLPDDGCVGQGALEAFQAGKPVVTTSDSRIARELVRNRVTGLVTEPDPPKLGAALLMLATQPKLAAKMGARGRRMVLRRPSWRRVVDKLLA